MLGHSHTRIFLLHAVVSQCAGGSGRQDVQEDVHLWTQISNCITTYKLPGAFGNSNTSAHVFFTVKHLLTVIHVNSDGCVTTHAALMRS